MRREFEMTEQDLAELMEACAARPAIMLHIPQISQQERANAAWERLGEKMGFDAMTVQPSHKSDERFFTAEPT